jgi:hypothetical protein
MERPAKEPSAFDTASETAKLQSRLRKSRSVRGGSHVPVLVCAFPRLSPNAKVHMGLPACASC